MTALTVILLQGFDAVDAGHPRPPFGYYAMIVQEDDAPKTQRGGTHMGTCRQDDWLGASLAMAKDLGADRCSVQRPDRSTTVKILRDGRWVDPPAKFRAETTLGQTKLMERTFPEPEAEGGKKACLDIFVSEVRAAFPNVLRRQKIRIVGEDWDYEISGKIG